VFGSSSLESGSFDFGALAARIAHAIHTVKASRVVIDPLDAPFTQFSDVGKVRRELAGSFAASGRTT
jgi:circadian clock protein KaiC